MNFRQLEAFIYVIKYRSFSKAAETIYISQPTVSIHINALEDELGVPLLIRSTRGIFPTEAGKTFYNYAMQMMQLREKSIAEIKKFSAKVGGTLEVAASSVPAQYIIPEILPSLITKYPDIFFTVLQLDTEQVVTKVENMEVEVGIGGSKIDKSNCIFTPFMSDELVFITPNNEQFRAMGDTIDEQTILKSPFISREKGSGTRLETESQLQKCGINPHKLNVITQMQSTESIKQAVKNGLGISVVSRFAVKDFLEFGSVLAFNYTTPMTRQFYIVTRKGRPLSNQGDLFIKSLREHFKQ